MHKFTITKEQIAAVRHYGIVMAFAVLCVVVPYFTYQFAREHFFEAKEMQYAKPEQPATSTPKVIGMARSLPVRLRIPKMQLDVPFEEPLGLNADRTIQAPRAYTDVGWYQYGATPGEIGSAVVLGHVDTYKGAAVFYHLGELSAGDEVYVDREDGTTATFVVQELHRYLQSDFPSHLVYDPTPYPSLRLITCTGTYDHGTQRYDHNLVVFLALKGTATSNVSIQ